MAQNEKIMEKIVATIVFTFDPDISLNVTAARSQWIWFGSPLYRAQPEKISQILVEYFWRYFTCKMTQNEKIMEKFFVSTIFFDI